MSAALHGDGTSVLVSQASPSSSFVAYRLGLNGALRTLGALSTLDPGLKPQLHLQPDGALVAAQWRSSDRVLRRAHLTASGSIVSPANVTLPTTWPAAPVPGEEALAEDLNGFNPVLFSATNNQTYLLDRNSGRMGRLNSLTFERMEGYDLPQLVTGLSQTHFYALPHNSGLGVVGRPDDAPSQIEVRELYWDCFPQANTIDTDTDGVGDLLDNCPDVANPAQDDLDGDGNGDACDIDKDGDQITNDADRLTIPGENGAEPQVIDLSADADNDGTPDLEDDDRDGDGIPDSQDPFPLDSSNDGRRNAWSYDADADSVSDGTERTRGTNPYTFLDHAGIASIIFATEADDGHRTLYRGTLASARDAVALELPATMNPHGIEVSPSGRFLSFLTAAPGTTETFAVYDLREDTLLFERNVGAALRSISVLDEGASAPTSYVATQQRFGDTERWRVSRITVNPDVDVTTLFAGIDHVWEASQKGNFLIFNAFDRDCRECALTYAMNTSVSPQNPFRLNNVAPGARGLHHSVNSERFWVYQQDPAGEITLAEFSVSGTDAQPLYRYILPERFTEFQSHTGLPSSPRVNIFAASGDGEPTMIWYQNTQSPLPALRLVPLAGFDDPVVEVRVAP
ncbi:hypothetical protein DL240_12595 [Lujinxingia litoralis]|uniref:Uncharacterized protein n=2 Tax=Lujinxingia litoralis TaxID=2211119 RepID=A0A328C5I2_9DELT|nr:hypothetical protein DL240_12595 [Lujinxingia litoralis]